MPLQGEKAVRGRLRGLRRQARKGEAVQLRMQGPKAKESAAVEGQEKDFPWHGLDTETVEGKAVLVCTEETALEFPRSFRQILDWLFGHKYARFVAYNVDYDARALLAYLPKKYLRDLAMRDRTTIHIRPVRGIKCKCKPELRDYHADGTFDVIKRGRTDSRCTRIHYLPSKELQITRDNRSIYLYDAFQFFQGSLAKTAQTVLGLEKIDVPESWYLDFGARLRDPKTRAKVIEYCQHDARLALGLQKVVGSAFEEAGFSFDRPLSPGYIASQFFKGRSRNPNPSENTIFRLSFYGGRIEVWQRGRIGSCTGYDIRSAYPSVLADLIDPRGGRCERTDSVSEDALYGSYLITVETHEPLLPYRPFRGPIIYPVGTWTDWYSLPQLRMLERRGIHYTIRASWEVLREKADSLLFPEIPEWYVRRQKSPGLNLGYKLILNASYGKIAQKTRIWAKRTRGRVEVGDSWHNGNLWKRIEVGGGMSDYALAAHITASTQVKLIETALLDPENVVLLATDGILFRGEGPKVPGCGSKLGEWEGPTKRVDAIVIGAGVYATRKGDKWISRSRGFKLGRRSVPEILDTDSTWIEVPSLRADTLAEAARRGDYKRMNVLRSIVQRKNVNADNKRSWKGDFSAAKDCAKVRHLSDPWAIIEDFGTSVRRLKMQDRLPNILREEFTERKRKKNGREKGKRAGGKRGAARIRGTARHG